MTAPIANFSGLASGVQWNDLVEQLMKAEEARRVTPIVDRLDRATAAREAWTTFRRLVDTLNDTARALRTRGFGGFLTSVTPSPTSGRTLFSAAASSLAEPGRYRVEVVQTAETARLGGARVADRGAALGLVGDFAINGTSITIAATDSLTAIRDKINAANTGATPTGVVATIQNDGPTGGRLLLSAATAGAGTLTLTDGTGGLARELGFLDSRTAPVSSTTEAIAAAMGIAVSPPPATIRVGGRTITVDLTTDSIGSIVAKINAAGGQASAEAIAFGDETRYRLVTDGNVTADPGDANSQAVIDALGFAAGEAGAVRQAVATGAFTDAGGAVVTASTPLAGLRLDGADLGLAEGDAINIRGLRGDGTAVTIGIAIDPGETVQDLLDKINDATAGFGAGTRPATATLGADGTIRLIDAAGGASRLSMSMSIVRADGSTGSMGTTTVETAGRTRQLQEGRNAIVRVNGTEYVRSTNAITDAIPNVTLTLTGAEAGTESELVVERNVDGAADAVKQFTEAYTAVRKFYDEQRKVDAPLYGNSSLRSVVDSFTAALRTEAAGNETYTRATLAGVSLGVNGMLTFDATKFKEALAAKPAEVGALFGLTGIGGAFVRATDAATSFTSGSISLQVRSLDESTQRLNRREQDLRQRLEERRAQLVEEFTRMESALSRLNAQGTALAGLISSTQARK
jgi:flagellar hook-associated protein 2